MFVLLLLSCLPYAVSDNSGPSASLRATLKSSNMVHMLQWDRRAGPQLHYTVSFFTDRSQCCTVVPGCERVVEPLMCDLTEAFSDPEETYYVRVTGTAGSLLASEQSSSDFIKLHPIKDTELEPPDLQLQRCDSSLCVDLHAPVLALFSLYESFWYELKFQMDSQDYKLKHFRSLQRQVEPQVKVGSQYCVSIRFFDKIVPRNSSFSVPKCVYVPSPITAEGPVAISTFLLVFLLLVLLLLFSSGFICLRQRRLPSALNSVQILEQRLMVLLGPPLSSVRVLRAPAPPCGQTDSPSDSSEDESDWAGGQEDANACPYTSKGSFCSALSLGPSALHGQKEQDQLKMEESPKLEEAVTVEEVDLLTLMFSRDTNVESGCSGILSKEEQPVWTKSEEDQQETEEDFDEECCPSDYMSR